MLYFLRMENYELTLVLPEKTSSAKKKSVRDLVEKLLKTYEGKIDDMEDWGVKNLYYDIKGERSGVFLHFRIELSTDKANPLRDNLKMQDDINRFLLVVADKVNKDKK